MKRWKIGVLVSVALLLWGRAAVADLLYVATDSANVATVGMITGKEYSVKDKLWGGVPQFGKIFSFKDPNGKYWAVIDNYSYSDAASQDTIDIFDPKGTWKEPQKELKEWGRNLYGLATADNYLYVAAFERREGEAQKSGEIVRVDMTKGGFTRDREYLFDPLDDILRRPCAVQVIDDKVYVLTYTYDGTHSDNAQFNASEVFEFNRELKLLRTIPLGQDNPKAKNAQRMQVFDGKLYVGTTGGAQEAGESSVGGIWEIDPSGIELSQKPLLDLSTLKDSDLDGKEKGVLGFQIAKDGTVYLLVGGYDSTSMSYISKFYTTTMEQLLKGEIGESVPSFPSVSEILYDEQTATLWARTESWLPEGGGTLYAYDQGAKPLKTFTPADLGNAVFFWALLEGDEDVEDVPPPTVNPGTPVAPSPNSESGGGCNTSYGAVGLLLMGMLLRKYRIL
ncbi:MAG: hypothetical protein LBJ36_04140 [Synergistaceae bacterium]|nr:hypothetical protein [Synergistaceae bacterium]